MAKPWARVQVGYMRHPKFLAISGNAISLWHEGKDWCGEHQTDGLIPHTAVKGFRFGGVKSIKALLASCGEKGDGTAYAPLWEVHPIGYKMHDYLDHNPCRDEALAWMDRADAKREADRERLRARRESQKHVAQMSRATNGDVSRDCRANVAGTVIEKKSTEKKKKDSAEVSTEQKHPPVPHPVKAFLTLYETEFMALTGSKPVIYNGRDAKIAKDTITKMGEDKARTLLKAFFASDDQFIRRSGFGLNVFAGQLNKLIAGPLAAPPPVGVGRTGAAPKGKYDGIEEQD